jgi:nuclear pore complex protein Nup214
VLVIYETCAGGFGSSPVFDRSASGFGTSPTFGGAPTFGGSPTFGSPGKVFGSSSPTSSGELIVMGFTF